MSCLWMMGVGMLTVERARELFSYDPGTGILTRRKSGGGYAAGTAAGHIKGNGYIRLSADRKTYAVHRVAWLIVTGEWPKGDVDHIDMDRQNNRWENLRVCTRSENMHNTRAKSGIKGVCWEAGVRRWRASAYIHGSSKNLGRYACLGKAIRAYREACVAAYGEVARFA